MPAVRLSWRARHAGGLHRGAARPFVEVRVKEMSAAFSWAFHSVCGVALSPDFHTHAVLRQTHPEFFEMNGEPFEPAIGWAKVIYRAAVLCPARHRPSGLVIKIIRSTSREVDIEAIVAAVCQRERLSRRAVSVEC